jgi:5-methylcytosine-specific restriction protein A
LADRGADTIDNVVAVCPNCHRACHSGSKRHKLRTELYRRIGRLVRC